MLEHYLAWDSRSDTLGNCSSRPEKQSYNTHCSIPLVSWLLEPCPASLRKRLIDLPLDQLSRLLTLLPSLNLRLVRAPPSTLLDDEMGYLSSKADKSSNDYWTCVKRDPLKTASQNSMLADEANNIALSNTGILVDQLIESLVQHWCLQVRLPYIIGWLIALFTPMTARPLGKTVCFLFSELKVVKVLRTFRHQKYCKKSPRVFEHNAQGCLQIHLVSRSIKKNVHSLFKENILNEGIRPG
ncbi:unnamed protein product [Protopolystoma xenopodis]|uniref:Uncharacterized protein n=1 Tax=Protopolystoma xenopodis TaxID=117903 RepID=A0A3S5CJP8_9PLAT|nr:unnamed protein product [Protopolystoma xenopodis]